MVGVFFAAVAVGCGGGGGGGGTKGIVIDGGTAGNNGHVGGDPTTGTTSGTTTTGSGNTGTNGSGSTDSGTTGSGETTGTTGSGSTDSGSTGGTTSSGAGGTTGGSNSGGGTAGATGTGLALRPNAIYFGHGSDLSLISSVLPDGSDRRDEGGFDADVVAAAPDVSRAKGFVYAKRIGGAVGVYRGESFDPSASETLAAPSFDDVTSLAVASDGAVAMVAVQTGRSRVFLLANGATRFIDGADGAAISPDGTKVAYSKPEGGFDSLCVWDRATSAVARTVTGGDSLFPSFSKDGAWIVFSSNRDDAGSDAPWDLYQIPMGGGSIERLTDTPSLNELGASYNEGRSAVAFVGVAADPNGNGIYVLANSGATRVARDADLTLGTYWTDLAGRSLRVRGGRFQRLNLPRR